MVGASVVSVKDVGDSGPMRSGTPYIIPAFWSVSIGSTRCVSMLYNSTCLNGSGQRGGDACGTRNKLRSSFKSFDCCKSATLFAGSLLRYSHVCNCLMLYVSARESSTSCEVKKQICWQSAMGFTCVAH